MTVQVKSLTETDYAYLAGIIDGEGTVTIRRLTERKRERIYVSYGPAITVSNTDLIMLKSLRNRFGGNIVRANPPRNKRWSQGYLLCFRREEMLVLLPKTIPYMTRKRRKAELLLEYMTTRTKSVATGAGGRFVSVPLTERQREIIAKIRKKNKRGPPI